MKILSYAMAMCVLFASLGADAEPKRDARVNDYEYVFTDDPVNAGLLGQVGNQLTIMPKPTVTLIRPRTAFVVELLKSVEAL